MKLTNKVRSLRPEEVLSIQMHVQGEMRKSGKSIPEAQKELKKLFKEISTIKSECFENVQEKMIYAIYLVNIYPELKSIKKRSGRAAA